MLSKTVCCAGKDRGFELHHRTMQYSQTSRLLCKARRKDIFPSHCGKAYAAQAEEAGGMGMGSSWLATALASTYRYCRSSRCTKGGGVACDTLHGLLVPNFLIHRFATQSTMLLSWRGGGTPRKSAM